MWKKYTQTHTCTLQFPQKEKNTHEVWYHIEKEFPLKFPEEEAHLTYALENDKSLIIFAHCC